MNEKIKLNSLTIDIIEKRETISGPEPSLEVKVDPAVGRKFDLVFVIDTTGSMSNKIESLLATCKRFVDEFASLDLDQRIAIVAFGDLKVPGDKIVKTAFTSKVEVTKKSLRNIPRYSGGGNEGESSMEALDKALSLPFRPNVVKVFILITDEPAHQHKIRANDMILRLGREEVLTFVVSPPISYFKEMAIKTGGKWYRVAANTDFTDLLALFREIAEKVSRVVSEVYELGDGSVSDYLRLKPSEN